jgi:aspartate/methionine/tyrosine aminotransferase
MSRLGTESAFETLARARALERQGRDIIHLEIGEPDFETAPHIAGAGINAIRNGQTHYSPSAGLLELRQAVAGEVQRTRGVPVSPDEVVIVPGGKPIIFFAILALVEEGDEVIYPDPGFPIYQSMVSFVGGRCVPIPLREENDFRASAAELAGLLTDRTRLIILNSPQNPTGGVLTGEDLREIAAVIGERNLMVLSDEIYSRLVFDGEHHSLISLPGWKDRTILLDGFSKAYAMTGWRLGYGVMHPELAAQITRLMINSNSCTATFTQIAGIEALTGDQTAVEAMGREFQRRCALVVERLNRIPGFSCRMPAGAFYAFPNITGTGRTSQELATALLEEAGVAVLSGAAFGRYGEGFLRFSVANSFENLNRALDRIEEWTSKNL